MCWHMCRGPPNGVTVQQRWRKDARALEREEEVCFLLFQMPVTALKSFAAAVIHISSTFCVILLAWLALSLCATVSDLDVNNSQPTSFECCGCCLKWSPGHLNFFYHIMSKEVGLAQTPPHRSMRSELIGSESVGSTPAHISSIGSKLAMPCQRWYMLRLLLVTLCLTDVWHEACIQLLHFRCESLVHIAFQPFICL